MAATLVAARIQRNWLQRLSVIDIFLWAFRVAVLAAVVVGTFRTLYSGRYAGEVWIDFVVFGVSQGSVYALIALGYTMVYGILRMINFAMETSSCAGPTPPTMLRVPSIAPASSIASRC